MKFSGLTIVAPRFLSSRATYPPAKPPPTTSVPPLASRSATPLLSLRGGRPGSGHRQRARARGARGGGGRLLAERGCTVVTGGLGEVMEAAARGAKSAGGTTIGILPGQSRSAANQWIDHAVVTGVGHAR